MQTKRALESWIVYFGKILRISVPKQIKVASASKRISNLRCLPSEALYAQFLGFSHAYLAAILISCFFALSFVCFITETNSYHNRLQLNSIIGDTTLENVP